MDSLTGNRLQVIKKIIKDQDGIVRQSIFIIIVLIIFSRKYTKKLLLIRMERRLSKVINLKNY